jgi:hypothetical protein
MALFWYPEINCKHDFEGKPDKSELLSSYIRYYLARLQSMFKYEGLPDSIPQKWLENYLLVNGSCVFIKNGDDLIVTRAGIGGEPDVYYIPTKCIVSNPYVKEGVDRTYTRDVDCVLMVNDTYAQGLLPLLKKYCSMMVENDITMNIADITSRASIILSAIDDNTKDSATLFIKRLIEGNLSIIGETTQMLGNQDRDLTVNQLTASNGTLTNLIEYHQYLKASLFNELGLNSNYNMKRESINSNESQLNDDMLHPLIDTMLECRKEALEKVNSMFGTNITVEFNSAWEMNEIEEEAAVEQLEAAAEPIEETSEEVIDPAEETTEEVETVEEVEPAEEVTEEAPVELSEETIDEIAEAVVEKIEESEGEENVEETN